LGELTQIVPFEMVDAVVAGCGAAQRRLRKLPARVVVYLLLAAALFEECGYPAVWSRLTAALGDLPAPVVTATALWHARARLGTRPLRALFDLLRGPASAIRTAGARWAGMLVVAIDGTCLDVPDSPAARVTLGKGSNQYTAASGYPQIRLVALVACGTRAIIDAVFGPAADGEPAYAARLLRSLHAGMIVLLDRGLSSNALLAAITCAKADFLAGCLPAASRRSCNACPMAHSCRSWAASRPGSSNARSPSPPRPAPRPGPTGWPPPCSITTATRHSSWSSSTTSAGRSNRPTSRSKRPCSAAASCAPAPCLASPRKSTPC
jgi:Insertion element 4 transposase N-terminal/Transposase DDE domain